MDNNTITVLSALQDALNKVEELNLISSDTACDILSNCLTEAGLDYDQFCDLV